MTAFSHLHLFNFRTMNDDYDQSLLKGADLNPFANYAGIAPDIWSGLPLLEQFLINDTLIKYSGAIQKNTQTVSAAQSEKHPTGSMQGALLYLKQPKSITNYLSEFLILYHLNHKVLFHPVLIPTVLNDKKAWTSYMDLLPMVMRERAWWLATQQPRWAWWQESISKSTWGKTGNEHRYNLLNILVRHSPGQAAELIRDSMKVESPESLENILFILGRRLQPVYQDILLQIAAHTTGRVREEARALSCLLPDSPLLNLLQNTLEAGDTNIDKLVNTDWSKVPDLANYYQGNKKGSLPAEVLMVHPYQQYYFGLSKENNGLGFGILGIKKGLSTANWLFRKYVIARDWQSLVHYYSDLMAASEEFAFNAGTAEVLLGLDTQTFNTMWSEISTMSETAAWHLTFAVYSMGIMPLQDNNAAKVTALFKRHAEDFEDYQHFNNAKTVFVNLYFSISPSLSDKWMQLIHKMIDRITINMSQSKQTALVSFFQDITHFKKEFSIN